MMGCEPFFFHERQSRGLFRRLRVAGFPSRIRWDIESMKP